MACSKCNILPLHVGTDCTGLGSIFLALNNLGVHAHHRFSSEVDVHARRQVNSIAPADIVHHDMRLKDMRSLPKVDIYVAGFPCQPLSTAGLRDGFDAKDGNGVLFFLCLRHIRAKRPTEFILENVQGLESSNEGKCFDEVFRALCLWSQGFCCPPQIMPNMHVCFGTKTLGMRIAEATTAAVAGNMCLGSPPRILWFSLTTPLRPWRMRSGVFYQATV